MTYGQTVEVGKGKRKNVVATDHAGLWQAFVRANFDFGADTANRSCYRSASDRTEYRNCGVTGEDTDGTSTGWIAKICPKNVIASYHAGAVFAASRAADLSSAASGGWRTYAATSSRSFARSSSVLTTA